MFKSKGNISELGSVLIEGLLASSFLILTTFGAIDLAKFLKGKADLGRILQQTALLLNEASSCSKFDGHQNISYLPDDLIPNLAENGNPNSLAMRLMNNTLRLHNLDPADYTVDVDTFADIIDQNDPTQILTGYIWLGIKANTPSKIIGIPSTLNNCHTLLLPIPTSLDQDDLTTGNEAHCPDMQGYQPLEWEPVENSTTRSTEFCK